MGNQLILSCALLHKARHFGAQLTGFYDKKHKTIPYRSCLIHIILEYNRLDAMIRNTIYSLTTDVEFSYTRIAYVSICEFSCRKESIWRQGYSWNWFYFNESQPHAQKVISKRYFFTNVIKLPDMKPFFKFVFPIHARLPDCINILGNIYQ